MPPAVRYQPAALAAMESGVGMTSDANSRSSRRKSTYYAEVEERDDQVDPMVMAVSLFLYSEVTGGVYDAFQQASGRPNPSSDAGAVGGSERAAKLQPLRRAQTARCGAITAPLC